MIGRIRLLRDSMGPGNTLLYLTSRVLQLASRGRVRLVRYLVVAQPVPPAPLPGCRPSPASSVAAVLPANPLCASFPRPQEIIARRFANGDTCLVATVNGRFAGFLWYARNHYEEDEVRCNYVLADYATTAWDYDVYVEPEFRLGRTLSRLWAAAHAQLRAEGIRWTFSRISAFNANSLNSHRQLGARPFATLTFLCLGPLQLGFGLPGRRVHLCVGARGRPEYRLPHAENVRGGLSRVAPAPINKPPPPPQNTG
ncbi:MAG: GNAT family N-acetyltransferase [Sulfuritalea sp.]|nr:GNAT family N-acetyltransferase [Sulfuritalea sp.]